MQSLGEVFQTRRLLYITCVLVYNFGVPHEKKLSYKVRHIKKLENYYVRRIYNPQLPQINLMGTIDFQL